ncbi:hypothetical protein GGX14DRAFT_434327, partial [Mycena pura]
MSQSASKFKLDSSLYHRHSTPPPMPPSSPSFAPSFQIIVVPPAEDQLPDYLVFNADDVPEPNLASPPNFASLDDALVRLHSEETAPAFNRAGIESVIMPRRSDSPPKPLISDETMREDSEIVEVVKVRRAYSQSQEGPPPMTKPKSLRFRAGRAFRSIKNLARASSHNSTTTTNRPYAQDVFASSQSTQATFATAPTTGTSPPLARRGSIILTNLFRTPSRVDSLPPSSALNFPATERYSDEIDDDAEHDDRESIVDRAPSPSPSARSSFNTIRRRLSILSFPRKARAAPPRSPSPPILSRGSTMPSNSSAPQTPTEETYPHPPST